MTARALVVTAVTVLALILGWNAAPAAEPEPETAAPSEAAPSEAAPAAGPLEQARAAYEERADPARARAALDLFRAAAAADPGATVPLWEGARACYFYGNYTRQDAGDDEKMALFQDGIDRCRAALAADPADVHAHFWLGVLYGVYGEARGILKSLALVPDIKQEMAFCLERDRSIEGHGPDRVLGRLYFKLPFFKGGDNDKSIEHLEASVGGEPANALSRLYLADTYRAEGKKEAAAQQLDRILEMTPDPRWTAEHPYIVRQAEEMLTRLALTREKRTITGPAASSPSGTR